MTPPSKTLWRTLLRVLATNQTGVYFLIPAWDVHVSVWLPHSRIPGPIRRLCKVDKRFHARVNTGAMKVEDLMFKDWETE